MPWQLDSSVPLDPELPESMQSPPVRAVLAQILVLDPATEAGGLLLVAAAALERALIDTTFWTDALIAASGVHFAQSAMSDVISLWLATTLDEPPEFPSQRKRDQSETGIAVAVSIAHPKEG